MSPLLILSIIGMVVSLVLLTWSAAMLLSPDSTAGQRLRQVTAAAPVVLPELVQLQPEATTGGVAQLEKLVPKSPKEMSRLRARLARAGIKSPAAAVVYSLSELVLPVILGGIPFLLL